MTLIRPDEAHGASELLDVERLTTALSAEWLEQNAILPLRIENDRVIVGTWHALVDPLAIDDLRLLFGLDVVVHRFNETELRTAIRRVYAQEADTAQGVIAGMASEARVTGNIDEIPLDDLLHLANEAPVVRLVNLLLIEAREGYQDGLRVRYR